jgi:hypothetical protein
MLPKLRTPLESSMMLLGCGSSGGGAAIAPPVAGPEIWLAAWREAYAGGDPVGIFTDWSGNGHDFTASGTARPTFMTNRINGQPTVQSDGVDDGMLLASLAAQTAWSLFYVGRLIADTGVVNVLSVDRYDPDGSYILWQYGGSSVAVINAAAGAVSQCGMPVGTAYSYALTGNGTTGTIRASDNTNGSTSANFSKVSAPMDLFRRGDGLFANYEIAELLFYPSVLGSSDRTTIWNYFNTRYGTAIPASP